MKYFQDFFNCSSDNSKKNFQTQKDIFAMKLITKLFLGPLLIPFNFIYVLMHIIVTSVRFIDSSITKKYAETSSILNK